MVCGARYSQAVHLKGEDISQHQHIGYLLTPVNSTGSHAVHFTFKNDSDIPIKWREMTLGEFWLKIESAGIYLKPADVKNKSLSLAMLVAQETIVSVICRFT